MARNDKKLPAADSAADLLDAVRKCLHVPEGSSVVEAAAKAGRYAEKHVRPWGYFRLLDQGPGFVVKALLVKGHQRLSLQRHAKRDEQWVVVMGTGTASLGDMKIALKPGDSLRVPRGATHRLINPGAEPLIIIETQTGEPDEDDIERLEDDYGRKSPVREGGRVAGAPAMHIGPDNPEVIIPLGRDIPPHVLGPGSLDPEDR